MVAYPPREEMPSQANVQSTVLAVDRLLIYTMSAQSDYEVGAGTKGPITINTLEFSDWLQAGLKHLWPISHKHLSEPERPLDDRDYETLATLLHDLNNSERRSFGFVGAPRIALEKFLQTRY